MSATGAAFDVAIVGGGMVGASLALALSTTRASVVLIEPAPAATAATDSPSFDARTTALGNGARRIFETLGVWEQIATAVAPIRSIHVSDAGHGGSALLQACEHGLEALGYTVSNHHLGAVLWAALSREQGQGAGLTLLPGQRVTEVQPAAGSVRLGIEPVTPGQSGAGSQRLDARLVVAADGAHSLVKRAAGIRSRSRPYGQIALVAPLITHPPAGERAYERFTPIGPIALLPRHDEAYTVVWTVAPEQAEVLRACSSTVFCARLQDCFGWRAGRLSEAGARSAYPLALVCAETVVGARIALVGNAAQTLHPVAAQGFNLGLRDAAVLAELIAQADDPGDPGVLAEFVRRRRVDRRAMIAFTDRLVRLFGSRRRPVVGARDLGLWLFDMTPIAKRALARLSWGFGDGLPRLARGLPLLESP